MKMPTGELGLEHRGEVFNDNMNGLFQIGDNFSQRHECKCSKRKNIEAEESLGLNTEPWNFNSKMGV